MRNIRLAVQGRALLASLLVLLLGAPAQADDRAGAWDYWWLSDPIEGVWNAKVSITPCPTGAPIRTFNAIGMFARGGTFHDVSDSTAVGPGMQRTAGFGSWERGKWREYKFVFKYFRYDGAGMPIGFSVVRHDVALAKDGTTYVSEGTAEHFNADGTPVAPGGPLPPTGCSNSTATRLK
jgi:hypothetical protein